MIKKSFLVLLTLIVLLAIGAIPALADQPWMYTVPFYDPPAPSYICGFEAMYSSVGEMKLKWFYDNDGNFDRLQVKVTGVDTTTNPANGVTLSGKFNHTMVYDYEDRIPYQQSPNSIAWHGLAWHYTYPGAGRVFFDTGNVVLYFDELGIVTGYSMAGIHQGFNADFSELCPVLAGGS